MQHYLAPPRAIKYLIYATCGISIFCGLFDRLFSAMFGSVTPQQLLQLSPWGVDNGYFWQTATYPFVHHGAGGISLFFLIGLFFHMYILYFMGSQVVAKIGERSFLKLYLFGSVVAGCAAALWIHFFGGAVLAGPGPAIFALLTFWAMMHGEQELLFFFAFPIQAKWLVAGLLGASFLIDLSHGMLFNSAALTAGVLFGYGYGVVGWNLSTPFASLRGVDRMISGSFNSIRFRNRLTRRFMSKAYRKAKVYDFKTGKAVVDDEEFLDQMLTKISERGEDALSRKEKKRLDALSAKKRGRV